MRKLPKFKNPPPPPPRKELLLVPYNTKSKADLRKAIDVQKEVIEQQEDLIDWQERETRRLQTEIYKQEIRSHVWDIIYIVAIALCAIYSAYK